MVMDFTFLDHKENIPVLTWLGRKEWIVYKALSERRAISVRPVKFMFMPKPGEVDAYKARFPNEPFIAVGEKEFKSQPPEFWRQLNRILDVIQIDPIGTFWYYTLSKSLAGGPKLFRPLPEQCEALQHSSASYSFDDYKQPYPVIILEIPPDYGNTLKREYNIPDTPKFVLVHHDDQKKFINVSAFFNRSNVITHVTPRREEFKTIEDAIIGNRPNRSDGLAKELMHNLVDAEFDAAENVQRLGVNFAMMMSLYSVKDYGPLDPQKYKQWQQEARAKRRGNIPTRRAMEAQANLAASVNLLKFDQKVEFYDEVVENVPEGEAVEMDLLKKSPRSHWRRGHFANQPYGPGLRERKIIFRKPVMVRAGAFFGDVKNTSVTYTAHAARKPQNIGPKIGTKIKVVNADEVPAGTVGIVQKVKTLNTIQQIEIVTEVEETFVLICPPDSYENIQ
jgi:hypothetical protein